MLVQGRTYSAEQLLEYIAELTAIKEKANSGIDEMLAMLKAIHDEDLKDA